MIRRFLITGLALTALASGCAATQLPHTAAPITFEAADQPSATFDRYDQNRDGSLDPTEFVDGAYGDRRFIKAPTAEETTTQKVAFSKQFEHLDTNRDQRVSREEFTRRQE